MCSCCLSNFSLFNKLFYLLPSGHNNSLLSDCIPFFPSPFSVLIFCSHSILVMLHYSTFMRSGFQVSSDADVFSCAMGERLSFGFTWMGQWYIKVSEPLFQGFFEELTFTWGINEAGPATRMRKSKEELGIPGSEKWHVQRFREFISVQSLSCVQLCDPWTANIRPPCPSPTPRVYQTHVHWIGDSIQPSHSLSSPSPPVFNVSQHQDLFKWVSSSHQVSKVLEFQLQHQSFQWIFRTDLF